MRRVRRNDDRDCPWDWRIQAHTRFPSTYPAGPSAQRGKNPSHAPPPAQQPGLGDRGRRHPVRDLQEGARPFAENPFRRVVPLAAPEDVSEAIVIEHIGPEVWDTCLASLAKGGRLITCGATTGGNVTLNLRYVFAHQLTIKGSYMGTRAELVKAAELMGQGRLISVIDRTYPLEEIVEATRYVDTEQKTGSVVIQVAGR